MKHCMVKDCPKPVAARGACATHYKRWSRGKADYALPSPMDPSTAGKLGGAIGGRHGKKSGVIKGFALDRQRASRAGKIGGQVSRRYKHA